MPSYRFSPNDRTYLQHVSRDLTRANPIQTAPQYGLIQAIASGSASVKTISQKLAEEMIRATPPARRSKFAKEIAMRAKKNKARHAKRNGGEVIDVSLAERKSEEFHGREPGEVYEITETERYQAALTELGTLKELRFLTDDGKYETNITFKKKCPKLCCDPEEDQLEIIGGDQGIDVPGELDTGKNVVELGPCSSIVYETDKHHLVDSDGEVAEYEHEFAEEGGEYPVLFYDKKNTKFSLVGGSYTIEAEGIRN